MNGQRIDQFVGGQFAWFTGVVEDIMDPLQMGRIRVRCFGYHTDDKNQIPTDSLPWALVVTPIHSSSMSGVGISATGIERGSWVVGFFRDGPSAQDPLVIGSVPSVSYGRPSFLGFSDPTGKNPTRPGEVDTPIEARAEYSDGATYRTKANFRQENIETAVPYKVSSVAVDEPDSYYERKTWSNWDVSKVVTPSYPQNQVLHTKSGHVLEFDDTPGARRVSIFHASGTYDETNNAGDKTLTVIGNGYRVVFKDDNVYIKGNCNLTVDGDLRTLVKGNYHLEVLGNKTEYIHGSRQSKIGQSDQTEIDKEEIINVTSNRKERIGEELNTIVDGARKEIVGGNSDVLVKGDDGHIVMGARKEFTTGQIDMSGSSIYNINAAGEMNIETTSNMNILTVGDKMEIVVGNRAAMILQDESVVSVNGNMAQLVSTGQFTTTATAGGITLNGATVSTTATGALTLTGLTSTLAGGTITVGAASGTTWTLGTPANVKVT